MFEIPDQVKMKCKVCGNEWTAPNPQTHYADDVCPAGKNCTILLPTTHTGEIVTD